MVSTNRAFCQSPNRAFIESAHGVRGCDAGWAVCVCEDVDRHLFPDISLLTPAEQEDIIATIWRLAWGVNQDLEKTAGSSVSNEQLGGHTAATAAERLSGGDFIIAAGSGTGVGSGKITRNRADGESTQVWAFSSGGTNDLCVDGINRTVIHGGGTTLFIRDVDTGFTQHVKAIPGGFPIEELAAIPVEPGGAYLHNSNDSLIRIDAQGGLVWSKAVDTMHGLTVDPQGNAYAFGGVYDTLGLSFDPVTFQQILTLQSKPYVRKYNLGGGLEWEWSTSGVFRILTPPGPPGEVPSDDPVQLQCTAAASDGNRVFVISDHVSESGIYANRALVLDADTGAFIQRVPLTGDVPEAGADSNNGVNPLWVTANDVLVPVKSPDSDGTAYIRHLRSTPQESGPDEWSTVKSVQFYSRIKNIRPVVTLAPPP